MPVKPQVSLWRALFRLLWGARARHEVILTDPPTSPEAAAQLHAAEYQALANRITCWITLQYSIGGLILAQALELLGQPHIVERGMSFWGIAVLIQILLGAYCFALSEIMNTTHYIESELASKIDKSKDGFWGYEKYKNKNRVYSPQGMYIPVGVCIGVSYVVLSLRLLYLCPLPYGVVDYFGVVLSLRVFDLCPFPYEVVDYFGASLSAVAAGAAFFIARVAVLAQKKFSP